MIMTVRECLERFTKENAFSYESLKVMKDKFVKGSFKVKDLHAVLLFLRVINGDEKINSFYDDVAHVCNGCDEPYKWNYYMKAIKGYPTTTSITIDRDRVSFDFKNKTSCVEEFVDYVKSKGFNENSDVKEVLNSLNNDDIFDLKDKIDLFIGFFTDNEEMGFKSVSEDIKSRVEKLITEGRCRQIIFTGAPGTGKTRIAKEIAQNIGASLDEKKYQFVQFHPSYDYTDFVEGLRPINKDDNNKEGNISFVKMDGIFKEFCRKVVQKNNIENLYFFIIDEINRANLSKVFGELMYCFEKDKRGKENSVTTQYNNLKLCDRDGKVIEVDEFEKGFYIPENVVLIGTMNDIDRSVDSMDFALRRRFEWVEFVVNEDLLTNAFSVYGKLIKDNTDALVQCTMALNKVITTDGAQYGLNRQYYISQGQFANLPENIIDSDDLEELKKYVWKYRIESLLREYLRGEDEANIEKFLKKARDVFFEHQNNESKKG